VRRPIEHFRVVARIRLTSVDSGFEHRENLAPDRRRLMLHHRDKRGHPVRADHRVGRNAVTVDDGVERGGVFAIDGLHLRRIEVLRLTTVPIHGQHSLQLISKIGMCRRPSRGARLQGVEAPARVAEGGRVGRQHMAGDRLSCLREHVGSFAVCAFHAQQHHEGIRRLVTHVVDGQKTMRGEEAPRLRIGRSALRVVFKDDSAKQLDDPRGKHGVANRHLRRHDCGEQKEQRDDHVISQASGYALL